MAASLLSAPVRMEVDRGHFVGWPVAIKGDPSGGRAHDFGRTFTNRLVKTEETATCAFERGKR